jgi:hypothetical protein
MKQRKWHKEIKAWADGVEIQERYIPDDDIWITLKEDDEPFWHCNDYEYRIKPQPKEPQYLYVFKHFNTDDIDITINDERNSNMVEIGQMQYIGKIKLEVEDE